MRDHVSETWIWVTTLVWVSTISCPNAEAVL